MPQNLTVQENHVRRSPKRSQLPAAVWINKPIHHGTAAA
jgi:hypothetical protein